MKTLNKYIYILYIKNKISVYFVYNRINIALRGSIGIIMFAKPKENTINFFEQLSLKTHEYKMISALNPTINIYKKMINTLKLLKIIHAH